MCRVRTKGNSFSKGGVSCWFCLNCEHKGARANDGRSVEAQDSPQGGLANTLADPTIAPKVRHFDLSLRRGALAYNFFETRNSSRKFSDEICGASPRASGRLGPGPTKSSAVGCYFKAGIPALSFSLSSRGVWVSLFGQAYRPVSDLANSVSGPTSGETFVAGD
jgi:hypothetical protein